MQKNRGLFLFLLLFFGSVGLGTLCYTSYKNTPSQTPNRSLPIFEALQGLDDTAPIGTEERFTRAKELLSKGLLSSAITDLKEILSKNPENLEAQKLLITAYIRDQNYPEAENEAKKVLAKNQNSSEFLLLLGEIQLFRGDIQSAKASFAALPEKSVERIFYEGLLNSLDGKDDLAKKGLENIQKTPNFGEKAAHILSAYQEYALFPDGNPNHLRALLAKRYQDLGFHALTIEKLRETLKEKPDYRDAWLLVGYSYLSLKRYLPAQNALEKALSLDPTKAETSFYLGLTLTELNLLSEAIIQFQNATTNGYEPKAIATKKLAETLFRAERYSESVEAYQKTLSGDGVKVDDFVRPVWIALDFLHSPEMGLGLAQQSVKQFPNEAMGYNLLGWALLEKGNYDLSEEALTRAQTIAPSMAAISLNFGKLREKQGRKEEALESYKKTFSMDRFGAIGMQAAERYNALLKTL